MSNVKRPILILEDEPLDAYTITKELSRSINNPIIALSSARQVQDFLLRKREYASLGAEDVPVAMLFDVRIPGISGLELMKWCADAGKPISDIPIVLCSQWNDEQSQQTGLRIYGKPIDGEVFLMELLSNGNLRCKNRVLMPKEEA
jgi:CheY-like chemotaxis protein